MFLRYISVLIFFCCAVSARADVVIFAAASLKEPVDQIAAAFDDVVVSYGGSGTIARQVSLGAPADIVLLANTAWMDVLVDEGHVQPETVQDFASNRLVLVGQSGTGPVPLTPAGLDAALGQGRLALGLTGAVPAGIYAKEALQNLGLWDTVEGRLAEVDNVRAALALVIRGQAPLGVVYQTDLRISDAVMARATFPVESHMPIRYTGARTVGADSAADAVLEAIVGPVGQARFAEAGFLPAVVPADD